MKWLSLYIIFLIWPLYSCSNEKHINLICEKQEYLAKILSHSSLGKSRGHNLLIFETFQGKKSNQYTFLLNKGICKLKKDNITYPSKISISKEQAAVYIAALNKKIDSLGIREYNGEPDGLGTLIMVYMKNGDIIFKTDSLKNITYPATLQRIKDAKKLCDDWYIANE